MEKEIDSCGKLFGEGTFEQRLKGSYKLANWESPLYEKLGVKNFKKAYLTIIGRPIQKLTKQKFISSFSKAGLEDAIENTSKIESAHAFGMVLSLPFLAGTFAQGDYKNGLITLGLNVLINLYPIMMQRFNREKMVKIYNSYSK